MLKYSTETLGPRFSETVLAELDPRFSRKRITLAPTAEALSLGMVLAKGANDEYAPYVETAPAVATSENDEASSPESPQAASETPQPKIATLSDSGDFLAVLISPVEASEESQPATVITGYAILNAPGLIFDKSVTDKKAALARLEARGLVLANEEADNANAE